MSTDGSMLRLTHITFAADDPASLARFWAAVLGYEAEGRGESWAAVDALGGGPELVFNRLAKSPTIELPVHLDVNVPDRQAEVERLVALGAKIVATKTQEAGELTETWTVMRDPEGNGFCVQGPDPRRPRPYLGNITFSCAEPRRVVGPFWARALGWPEQQIPADFLQMLRNAHVDVDREFDAYYAIRAADPSMPRLLFQRREKSRPASHPIHLDLAAAAGDREREVERLVAGGASVVETKSAGARTWTVLRDPEGTAFCIE
jgi:predicted enzyme related to lactoylglutathione lyase